MSNLATQAKNVASAGRFGDTTLIHVNEDELRGIASVMPLTINPETGYPEAFLPALLGIAAPMLGSALGSGFLASTAGAAMLGAMGSGIGSLIQGDEGNIALQNAMMGGLGGALGGATGGFDKINNMIGLGGAGQAAPASMAAPMAKPAMAGTGAAAPMASPVPMPRGVPSPPIAGGVGAAPPAAAAGGKGIGSLLTGKNMALAAMGLPLLGSMGGSKGPKPKKRETRRGTSFAHDRTPQFPGISPAGTESRYFRGFAQGGPVMSMGPENDQTIVREEAKAAIRGEHPQPEAAIQKFIMVFGMESIPALVEEVKAEAAGQVAGPGDGMSDSVPAVDPMGPVGLSDGEYVVPSDVVSGLGNGSTDAGAQTLDDMANRVRSARTGMPDQPPPINPEMVMPV